MGWSTPASDRCNIRLVQGTKGELYQINSETGVLRLNETNEVIIPPGRIELTDINEPRYDKSATVYVGIQGKDPDAFGRPILDAAFDTNYVYVVPVVVDPDGNDPYVAAAKLELLHAASPPYRVLKLYDDPSAFNPNDSDNPNLSGLRDIELDGQGNLYVLNVHSRNQSNILWRYEPNGAIERLDLGNLDSGRDLPGPVAMHVSSTKNLLYLVVCQD